MRIFDDFDAWGEAVSGASLRMACDAVETRAWTHGIVDLDGVVLQWASEGGGNVCYGGNTHTGPILFVPLTHAHEHVVNGEPLDDGSLFLIPRGADFRIRVRRRSHAWCSIALPADAEELIGGPTGSAKVVCPEGTVPGLRRLVEGIGATLVDRPAGSAARRTAAHDLLAAATACLTPPMPLAPAPGRPRLDRAVIVRRAMEAIDAAPIVPTAADLATQVGVNARTLLRTFRESFDMAPKRYLLLRELHAVRRSLRAGGLAESTVADVLTRHGIWEFGRFANRYRRHFGEKPSETLRRARD